MSTRYNPFSLVKKPKELRDDFIMPFSNLADEFFRIGFPDFSKEFGDFFSKGTYPKVNILNFKDKIIIKAAVPGFNKENIKVSIRNNILTIAGNKIQEDETNNNVDFICKELKQSQFSRSFQLNDNLNTEKISAKIEKGLLNIIVPKKQIETVSTDDYQEITVN